MNHSCLACGTTRPVKRSDVLRGKYKYCDMACRQAGLVNRGENSGTAKLSWSDVTAIRTGYRFRRTPQKDLARRYGVSSRQIWNILRGDSWSLS